MQHGAKTGAPARRVRRFGKQNGSVPKGALSLSLRVVDGALMRSHSWTRAETLAHLRTAPAPRVGLDEALRLAAHLPILFAPGDGGRMHPVAVIALLRDGNGQAPTRLGPRDSLPARYIPALAGMYPFVPQRQGETAVLAVDMASGLVQPGDAGAERFGDADGTPTPLVARLRDALPVLLRDHAQAETACAVLAAHGAFTPIRVGDDAAAPALALHAAHPGRVADLTGPALQTLWDSGAAALLHAHRVSLQHLPDLLHRDTSAATVPPAPEAEEGSFLAALMGDLSRGGDA